MSELRINMDFASLYPNLVMSFDDIQLTNKLLRERLRLKQIKERKQKLERINNLWNMV